MEEMMENLGKPFVETEKIEKSERSRFGLLTETLLRKARITLFTGLALLTPLTAGGKTAESGPTKTKAAIEQVKEKPAERIPLSEEKTEQESSRLAMPGVHFTFLEKDEKGETRFNPWSILAPVQLELGREIEKQYEAAFRIPYEYSRLFAAGKEAKKPLRAEDHEKIAAFVDSELKKQAADVLYGLDMSKRVYNFYHEEENVRNLKVNDIRVTGLASPEGPQQKGPATLAPESVDEENIALAKVRASAAADFTKESLLKLGVSTEVVQRAEAIAERLKAEEVQFTPDELRELRDLAIAQNEDGADDLEKIYNLVVKYNDNLVRDGQKLEVLDRIIASKRGAEVTVYYEGNKTEKLLIPIPLLLIIPPFIWQIRRRRRLSDGAKISDGARLSGGGEFGGANNFQSPSLPEKEVIDGGQKIFEKKKPVLRHKELEETIKKTALPPSETLEWEIMEEATTIDDLYVFFDKPETIRRGLDYRNIADEVLNNYNDFQDSEEREIFAAARILEGWKKHDTNARREAGWSEENLSSGLDYENQPRQIQWARMHGRAIIDLVEGKRLEPTKDYLNILEKRVKSLIQRRTLAGRD